MGAKAKVEKPKPRPTAKVHVDGDIRWPKGIREQLNLVPGTRYEFQILQNSKDSFTIKAVRE